MAKSPSDSRKGSKAPKASRDPKARKDSKIRKILNLCKNSKNPHKSFRRSYYEDYARPLKAPGLMAHAAASFKLIFKNWRVFFPLIIFAVILNIVLVGLMSEETYVQFQDALDETSETYALGHLGNFAKSGLLLISTITTGGLSQSLNEAQDFIVFGIFFVVWLVAIYLARHLLAGHKPKFRDGLYNALAPLISTAAVMLVLILECIPIMIVIITYSAAVTTDFLATPFYALIFFIFAALLILLSLYLLSSSFMALIAVSAPGLYPKVALETAADLMVGRRIKLLIRLFYLIFTIAFIFVIVMLPIILLDLWLKSWVDWLTGVPVIPFCLAVVTAFAFTYASVYCYLFYRRMLDHAE